MMALAIFLSYTLQFYVPVTILEPFVQRHFDNERSAMWSGIGLRVGMVIFTCKFYINVLPDIEANQFISLDLKNQKFLSIFNLFGM